MTSRSRLTRWGGAGALILGMGILLAGCTNQSPNILDPKGPVALTESNLFWIIFAIATFVFVAVTSALLYSVIRFRARPNSPEPRQVHGNTTIEIIWTVVPSIVLFIVLAVTISTMFALAQPSNERAITIRVLGHQWWWEFQYPNEKITTADEIHVPLNTVVRVELQSDNVIHSFWIPQLTGKTDVIPGRTNTMWFKATAPGTYRGECAEFCGTQHAHMNFVVVAEPMDKYQAWVAQNSQPAAPPADALAKAGQGVFQARGCAGCHQIDGVNKNPKAIGPNLTHFGSRLLISGGVVDNTPQNLRDWIRSPQTVKPGVDMPDFPASRISDQDLNALVTYLESLK